MVIEFEMVVVVDVKEKPPLIDVEELTNGWSREELLLTGKNIRKCVFFISIHRFYQFLFGHFIQNFMMDFLWPLMEFFKKPKRIIYLFINF
jgi:hypothetical protein